MRQTWRWFGPQDMASVDDMVQSGVEGVVSALHHIPGGEIWQPEEISKRQKLIRTTKNGAPSQLEWEVVESLIVSEDIKKQDGAWRTHIEDYKTSLRNLASAGIEVVCYNFMPVLDWTRTDLTWRLPHGGTCMRFDYIDFAVFDVFVLERRGAREDYPDKMITDAERRFQSMSDEQRANLVQNIIAGLPGASDNLDLEGVRGHLAQYDHIDADRLQQNLIDFLSEVVPVAEELGQRLCCHPDDPPFSLMGLPRVMSTEENFKAVTDAVDSPANGITLCSGSLGARPDNDLPGMMRRLGSKVHFLHLRNVRRDTENIQGSFYESDHLGGDVDLVALIAAIVAEEARRKSEGRTDHQIPMRPDHGHDILDDLSRKPQPGYPTIGRMRGLAELRGVMHAYQHAEFGLR